MFRGYYLCSLCLLLLLSYVQSDINAEQTILSEEDIRQMRVKELKQFLKDRGVECTDCVEKRHLVHKVLESREIPILTNNEEQEPSKNKDDEKNMDNNDNVDEDNRKKNEKRDNTDAEDQKEKDKESKKEEKERKKQEKKRKKKEKERKKKEKERKKKDKERKKKGKTKKKKQNLWKGMGKPSWKDVRKSKSNIFGTRSLQIVGAYYY